LIKELVESENSQKPLSDSNIAAILNDKGINVARRTIAKYREGMAIPSSSHRKRFS
jgi:RNA polymerase sigma-54 factor